MSARGTSLDAPGRLRFGTLLLVLGLYLVALVALVAVTLAFDIPLSEGEGFLVFPSPWRFLIGFAYYLAPPLIALGFGWRMRPFARHALALWLAIMLVQGGYSLAVTLMHTRLAPASAADRQVAARAQQIEREMQAEQVQQEKDEQPEPAPQIDVLA